MPGNSCGTIFSVTTYGESHGKAVGVIIDGTPPALPLKEADVQYELDRRRPGQSGVTTRRKEKDRVEIVSGVFNGRTTGAPISMIIRNEGADSSEYEDLKHVFRPGHADYTYHAKYGIRDWRGGGRASGRETAARVAAGAVAKKILRQEGISIIGYSLEIAGIRADSIDYDSIESNIVRSPDPGKVELMISEIEKAKEKGDSVGGVVEVVVKGCPAGLGDPVFDKLEALLAHAVMSIGAVRGIEVGCGFKSSGMGGAQYNDPFYYENKRVRTRTNNAGGILGGVSTGEDIILRAAVRPTASISIPQKTINTSGREVTMEIRGRHDPCIVPRIIPVVEAMVAVTLADRLLIQGAYRSLR